MPNQNKVKVVKHDDNNSSLTDVEMDVEDLFVGEGENMCWDWGAILAAGEGSPNEVKDAESK